MITANEAKSLIIKTVDVDKHMKYIGDKIRTSAKTGYSCYATINITPSDEATEVVNEIKSRLKHAGYTVKTASSDQMETTTTVVFDIKW